MGKKKVFLRRRNWDIDYMRDITEGRGFTITEEAEFQLDGKTPKALFGSRSPLYGTDYSDEQSFLERHRCECGEFIGAQFEGEICPICNTPVSFKDVDIEFTGWISLHGNYIIQPYYYALLSDVLGKTTLKDIVITKNKVDTDGHLRKLSAEEIEEKPKHPYVGIGLVDFLNNFEEVMGYFRSSKKNKSETIDKIVKEKMNVFTSHVPIYSTILRPQSYTSETFYYNSMDKHINPLFKLSEKLTDTKEIEIQFILSRIQKRVNALWKINFELMNGKEGWIRDKLLGGSLDFTSRNVIIPD